LSLKANDGRTNPSGAEPNRQLHAPPGKCPPSPSMIANCQPIEIGQSKNSFPITTPQSIIPMKKRMQFLIGKSCIARRQAILAATSKRRVQRKHRAQKTTLKQQLSAAGTNKNINFVLPAGERVFLDLSANPKAANKTRRKADRPVRQAVTTPFAGNERWPDFVAIGCNNFWSIRGPHCSGKEAMRTPRKFLSAQ